LVPRVLHQIWVGRDPLPKEFASYVETWKRHHPEWEHRMWTEENLPTDLRRPEVLERIRQPAERSDILRLELLWRHGGVYVDVDMECRSSLDPHIGDAEFFTAWIKKKVEGRPQRVSNTFMGSVPGHPLLDRALNELRPQEWYGFDKNYSGALFFGRLVEDYPDVLILPAELIYPDSPAEEENAVSIHHAARSWKDAKEFQEAAVRAEKRLRKVRGELEKEQRAHAKTRDRLERTEAKLAKLRKGREEPTEEAELEKLEKGSRVSRLLGRAR
jgi:mannosyltransferase OCH1-like enzyme